MSEQEFNYVADTLIEISMTYANYTIERPSITNYDFNVWKQEFVKWAKEFVAQYSDQTYWENHSYCGTLERFTLKKIQQFVEESREAADRTCMMSGF